MTFYFIARDLWIFNLSAQQLTQQMVGEYLMFFQNNTRSKYYYWKQLNFVRSPI